MNILFSTHASDSLFPSLDNTPYTVHFMRERCSRIILFREDRPHLTSLTEDASDTDMKEDANRDPQISPATLDEEG